MPTLSRNYKYNRHMYNYFNSTGTCPPNINIKNSNGRLYNVPLSYSNYINHDRRIYVTLCRNCNRTVFINNTTNNQCIDSSTLFKNFR